MAINHLLMIEVIKAIIYATHIIKGQDEQDAIILARAYGTSVRSRLEIMLPDEPVEVTT